MEKELIPMGQAAEMLDVSIDTLRRWADAGRFPCIRKTPTGNRYFKKEDIKIYLNDILSIAKNWISTGGELPAPFYCSNSAIFQTRLQRMQSELANIKNEEIQNILSLVVAVAGEIGNNSFDHNLGNWPDIAGIFFAYDLSKRQVVLADRGQGILKTLQQVRPSLIDDKQALKVAFTEVITGRAPEERGNGLKFVRQVVTKSLIGLSFQTGSAQLKLEKNNSDLNIQDAPKYYRGCIAFITY